MPLLISLDRYATILGRSSGAAVRDLVAGAHRWRVWYVIGSAEMRRRFARARLGQLWIMLSSALSVSIMGFAWALLWKEPVHDILPFISISVTVWQFLAAVLNDAATAFPQSSQYFLNQYMPASTIIYSALYKNVATFLLNMVFPIFIVIFLGDSVTTYSLLSVVGLSLVIAWCLFIGDAVPILCTRFPDIAQMVATVLHASCLFTHSTCYPCFLPP